MQKNEIRAVAEAVAEALGESWTVQPVAYRTFPQACSVIQHVEGYAVRISPIWNKADRWEIGGQLGGLDLDYKDRRPRITVARGRAPQSIADDIGRRLLPKYIPMWQAAVKRTEKNKQYTQDKVENFKKLAALCGKEPSGDNGCTLRFSVFTHKQKGYGDARATSDKTVDLDLRSLNYPQARAVLRALGVAKAICDNCDGSHEGCKLCGGAVRCDLQREPFIYCDSCDQDMR